MVSTACTQGYVEEAEDVRHDQGVLRRDLLDSLLGGEAEGDRLRREAASLRIQLDEDYLVVLVGLSDAPDGVRAPRSPSGRDCVGRSRSSSSACARHPHHCWSECARARWSCFSTAASTVRAPREASLTAP
jgi:hypothetical protein